MKYNVEMRIVTGGETRLASSINHIEVANLIYSLKLGLEAVFHHEFKERKKLKFSEITPHMNCDIINITCWDGHTLLNYAIIRIVPVEDDDKTKGVPHETLPLPTVRETGSLWT